MDYLLIGSKDRIVLEYDVLLERFQNKRINEDLKRVDIKNANEFLAHYVMDENEIKDYVKTQGVRLHTDENAFVEFSAPKALYRIDSRISLMEGINSYRGDVPPFLICTGGNKKELEQVKARVAKLIGAKKHITNGNIYLTRGRENLAIEEFEKALEQDPEVLPVVKRFVDFLAYAYEEKGLLDQAERLIKRIQALDPQRKEDHYNLGLIHYQKGEWDHAVNEFRLALESLESPEVYYNLSLVYQKKGELKEALWAVQKSLELNPDYAEGWNHLGNLYLAGNDLHLAAMHFEKALEYDPEHVMALINLGLVYTRKGQMEKAQTQFQYALRIDPNCVEAHNNLGSVYLGQGRYDQAISELNSALAIRPSYVNAVINLGMLYARLNDYQKAEKHFQQVLAMDSSCAEAYNQLGYLYILKKDYAQALSSYQEMVRLQPENPQAYFYMGKVYQAMDQTDESIQAWKKAVNLQPDLASAHLNIGNAYFEMGSFQKAELEWEKAFAGKPVDIPTHLVNLGMFYFRSTQYDRAIQAWERAGELKANDHHLRYNIALAYYQQGKYVDAARELKETLRLEPDDQSAGLLLQKIKALGGDGTALE
ncbi:MAG: tetratricopeptide repeat protein [bacterium]